MEIIMNNLGQTAFIIPFIKEIFIKVITSQQEQIISQLSKEHKDRKKIR